MKFPGKLEAGRIDGVLTESKYIKGTYIVVSTLNDRDSIPTGVKIKGSKCYVSNLMAEYIWNGDSWEELGNVPSLPTDENIYALQNGHWVELTIEEDIQNALAPIKDSINTLNEGLAKANEDIKEVQNTIETLDGEVVKYTVIPDASYLELNKTKYKDSVDIDDPTTPSFYTDAKVPSRRSIQLANYDSLSGFGTAYNGEDLSSEAFNLAMVSKWNVADFGSKRIHLNLNTKDNITVNDNLTLLDSEDKQELENSITQNVKLLQTQIDNLNENSLQASDITESTINGTFLVKDKEVNIYGLGTAAFTDSSEYDANGAAEVVKQELETNLTNLSSEITNNTNSISTINSKVPLEATPENQLVDKQTMRDFVNSSLEASAANFVSATNIVGGNTTFANFESLLVGPWYINRVEVAQSQLKKNDYAIYEKTVDGVGEQWRANYSGTNWEPQNRVGNSLTPDQQSAINSGITTAKVTQISDNKSAIETNSQNITQLQTNISNLGNNLKTIQETQSNIIDGNVIVGKATADANNNIITDTYATKQELETGLNTKQNTIEDVNDIPVENEYVTSVKQVNGKIQVTRASVIIPEVNVKDVLGVENNAVLVGNNEGNFTISHKTEGFADGVQGDSSNIQVVTSINVDKGHIVGVSLQSLNDVISSPNSKITIGGGGAESLISEGDNL